MKTEILLVLGICYLLGAIPFGYIIAKIWNIDIRRCGSGNIGATNVLRTLGPVPGFAVFFLDILKGILAIFLINLVTHKAEFIILAGLLAILGHSFSVFLKFKGGRGVATGMGVLLGIAPDIFIAAVIFAAVIIAVTRYISLASVLSSLFVAFLFILLNRPFPYVLLSVLIAVLITVRHAPNIKRILNRTEHKLW